MSIRMLSISLLAASMSGAAFAATPGDAPAEKPVLNHAPLNLNDSLIGTSIRGQAPIGAHVISVERQLIDQREDPGKPALNQASPAINDPLTGTSVHGTAGTVRDPRLDPKFNAAENTKPPAKPPLNRAPLNLNDGLMPPPVIRGSAPVSKPTP